MKRISFKLILAVAVQAFILNLSAVFADTSIISAAANYQVQQAIRQFRGDMERVKNLPETSLTAPCSVVQTDSTYTKSWTFADWECHSAMSLRRYARHCRTWIFSTTARNIFPTICVCAIWTMIASKLSSYYPKFQVGTTKMTVTLTFVQAPILLLLTLRTNRALDRMLEARRAWGALTKSTRSLMGLICAYIVPNQPEAGMLMARYIAFSGWALKAMLRKRDDEATMIAAMFGSMPAERDWLLNCDAKAPTALVCRLRHMISILGRDSKQGGILIPPITQLRMEEILFEIEQSIGICNRILASPIPPTYTRHTSRVLVLYMFLLPIALCGMNIPLFPAIVTSTFASYVLVGIDEIGLEIENPFSLLPLQPISSLIQREVETQVKLMTCMPPMP